MRYIKNVTEEDLRDDLPAGRTQQFEDDQANAVLSEFKDKVVELDGETGKEIKPAKKTAKKKGKK